MEAEMERLFKWTAKMSAWVLLLVLIPFVMSYLLGMILPTSDYWLLTKICRVIVLALIVVVPMLVQHWRENQRFFLKWVGFLLLYVIVTTFLWVKGF